MLDDIEAFRKIPILNAFTEEAMAELLRSSEAVRLSPGETLFRNGDRSEGAYFVVSGCIELRGDEAQSRRFVYPGSLIGELCLVADLARSVDARAHERTELRRIARVNVMRILQKDPVSATRVRAFLEHRASDLAVTLSSFQSGPR